MRLLLASILAAGAAASDDIVELGPPEAALVSRPRDVELQAWYGGGRLERQYQQGGSASVSPREWGVALTYHSAWGEGPWSWQLGGAAVQASYDLPNGSRGEQTALLLQAGLGRCWTLADRAEWLAQMRPALGLGVGPWRYRNQYRVRLGSLAGQVQSDADGWLWETALGLRCSLLHGSGLLGAVFLDAFHRQQQAEGETRLRWDGAGDQRASSALEDRWWGWRLGLSVGYRF